MMAQSTGPILAVGAVTIFNSVIIHDKPITSQVRTVVGTGIAAATLALMENAVPRAATALAWLALVAVLFVRLDPGVPAPAESFADWYEGGK